MGVKDNKEISTTSKIKISFIFLFFLLIFSIIMIRFYLLQVKKQDFFKNLGKQQYSTELTITPPRAQIFDRTGKIHLALNNKVKSAFIIPHRLGEEEKTLRFLKEHYPKAYEQTKKNSQKFFVWVDRHISKEKQQLIAQNNINDIQYLNEICRFYPFKELAPIVGFTDIDNNGIAGLELKFNKQLAGKPTTLQIEKDARANKYHFSEKTQYLGNPGEDIKLTINNKLQFLVSDELEQTAKEYEAKEGSAIVMDPDTGEILALANYPGFDPNTKNITDLETTKNKAVTECYEFGSVIKAFTALAALQEKVTTLDEEIDCEGKSTYIDKFKVENWKSIGVVPFKDVVRCSSNVGVAKIAKRLDTKLYDHFTKLGFGRPTNLGFPGERHGFVNRPNNWSRSSIFVLSFGYEINGTLMQLAKALSIIANGGFDVTPKIIISENNSNQKTTRLYAPEAIEQTKEILESIGEKYKIEDYRIMGKTGTARMIENGKYSNKKHVYTFGGIVEKGNYKRVVITFIKEPKRANIWAAQLTAPLFQRIAEKMILLEQYKLG